MTIMDIPDMTMMESMFDKIDSRDIAAINILDCR